MKTDQQLRQDVIAELEREPSIHATQVGVAVKDGVVTLTGHLRTFAEKHAVERVVRRVKGVRAVAVEIDVRLDPAQHRYDTEIAAAISNVLPWHALVPSEAINTKVEKGWVTLSGTVDWDCQRCSAAQAARTQTGVVGVNNHIELEPHAVPGDVVDRIRAALTRHADREALHLEVSADGSVITLRGTVGSWAEHDATLGAARSAPGVTSVVNQIHDDARGPINPCGMSRG